MDDAGLLPRPSKGPRVHRPSVSETLGFYYCPLENLYVPDTRRISDGLSRGISNSVMMAEPQMITKFLSQSTGPLDAGSAFLDTAAKNGNTNLNKTGAHTKKAKVADPSKWKKNKQKQLRMEGKAYVSKRKKDGEFVTKQPRAVGPRCTSTVCKKACNRLCDDIDEDDRTFLFNKFWLDMNWAQRRHYVAEQVDCEPVERSRAAGPQSRRSVSYRYHLLVDGQRKQVCKNMFLSTLGIREWSVLNWAQKGATEKNKSNEDEVKKMEAVPVCQQQNPVSTPLCYTVDLTQEPVTPTEVDESRPTELEGLTRQNSRVAKPLLWKQNQKRQLRMEGKSYISKRKQDGTTVTKAERKLGPRCSSIACRRASNRFCADFSEEARSQLFTSFWQCMNWTQRKKYVAGLVDCDPVERTRAPSTKSRRSLSMRYHLLADGNRRQVCKKMFLSTLGIGEWSVLNWAQNPCQTDESTKKRMQRTSRKASEHIFLKEFLDSLPKVPSLCCGTSIPKLFLEPVFSNMSEVYRCYHNHCMEKKTTPLSRQVFCEVFKKMDLGLCDSKKDQGFGFGAAGDLFNELLEEYCIERGVSGSQLELQARRKDKEDTC